MPHRVAKMLAGGGVAAVGVVGRIRKSAKCVKVLRGHGYEMSGEVIAQGVCVVRAKPGFPGPEFLDGCFVPEREVLPVHLLRCKERGATWRRESVLRADGESFIQPGGYRQVL